MGELIISTTNGELYHHGIRGQKWGVRHDSYPLDASQHTSAEKKAGWRASLDSKVKDKKSSYKQAKKEYNLAYKDAHKKTNRLNITKKRRAERDEAISKMQDRAKDLDKAKQKFKDAKETRKKELVKDYANEYDKYEKMQNQASKKWDKVQKQYKDLAPTPIGRLLKVMKGTINKGDEATNKYLREWEKASEFNDKADAQWKNVMEAYSHTGKTVLGAIINNAKYDPNSKNHAIEKYYQD